MNQSLLKIFLTKTFEPGSVTIVITIMLGNGKFVMINVLGQIHL